MREHDSFAPDEKGKVHAPKPVWAEEIVLTEEEAAEIDSILASGEARPTMAMPLRKIPMDDKLFTEPTVCLKCGKAPCECVELTEQEVACLEGFCSHASALAFAGESALRMAERLKARTELLREESAEACCFCEDWMDTKPGEKCWNCRVKEELARDDA